jgi:membrane associated rhomboid family serine protease
MEGLQGAAVRVTPERERADEWAVVLAAAGIPHRLRHRPDGWALIVAPRDARGALDALDGYDGEKQDLSADTVADVVTPWGGATALGAAVALLLIGFFAITGPRTGHSAWFARGSAVTERIVAGEWWRAVTALTLHADAPHLLGNAVATVVLVGAVSRELGPGLGLWLFLLAGAGGNALTAIVHGAQHASVGASTAIFGAIGILATTRAVTRGRDRRGARKPWVILAACLALLALLGTSPGADVLAHLFGLLVGGALGLATGFALPRAPRRAMQWTLALATVGVLLASWFCASLGPASLT